MGSMNQIQYLGIHCIGLTKCICTAMPGVFYKFGCETWYEHGPLIISMSTACKEQMCCELCLCTCEIPFIREMMAVRMTHERRHCKFEKCNACSCISRMRKKIAVELLQENLRMERVPGARKRAISVTSAADL